MKRTTEPNGNVTARIVDRTTLDFAALSEDAIMMAKICLLDWFGVTLLGTQSDPVDRIVADLLREGDGAARVVGRKSPMRSADAALVNGMASHMLDYDDGLPAMTGHATVAIAPALFALAETQTMTGHTLLAAFVTGVEIAGCIGRLVAPSHYDRGFHATGTVGALAAAGACAHALDLDDRQRAIALGLAGTRASGLKGAFGTAAKPLQVGWSAMTGLTAARWAAAGIVGPPDILGHPQGFATTHGTDLCIENALAVTEGRFHILDTRFKRYASCGVTHSTLDALYIIGAGKLAREDIESVTVHIGRGADKICNLPDPQTGMEAKFSLSAVTAMALAGIDLADPASFSDVIVRRSDVVALMQRSSVELEDWPVTRSMVRVSLFNGIELSHTLDGAEKAASVDDAMRQVEAKFLTITSGRLASGRARTLIDAIKTLDLSTDVSQLIDITNDVEAPRLSCG